MDTNDACYSEPPYENSAYYSPPDENSAFTKWTQTINSKWCIGDNDVVEITTSHFVCVNRC